MADKRPRLLTLVLLLALGKAVILSAILGALWLRPLLRIQGYPDRLVREANALYEAPRERAVHRAPEATGSFGARAAAQIPVLTATVHEAKDLLPVAREIAEGRRPLSELPPELTPVLARAHASLAELLAGTRAPPGKLPARWVGFSDRVTSGFASLDGVPDAAALLAIEVRQALARGSGREALTMCADGLALGRDLALSAEGQPLIWHASGAAVVARLAPACAEAARADPAEAARMFRAIREALPPFSETVQREFVCLELFLFSSSLGDAAGGLGPYGQACAGERVDRRWNLLQLWITSDAWPDFRELRDAVVAAARLERGAREREADEVYRRVTGRAGSLSSMLLQLSFPNLVKQAALADDMRSKLDELASRSVNAAPPADP